MLRSHKVPTKILAQFNLSCIDTASECGQRDSREGATASREPKKKKQIKMFTKCGEYREPWQILWIWCRILTKGACQCQPHPRTHWGCCYCYYLFVVLTHHLWHFQSIPATPDPVAVLPEIWNANVMPVLGISASFSGSASSSTEALKKCSTFGSQNNQNILYVAFSVPYSTSAAKAHELCAKNAAHVVTVSVVFASCRISPCSLVCPPSPPPLVTAVNLSVSHYATAS